MTQESLDIAEVVKMSGIPTSTLRYYEEIGLIRSVGRKGLRRQFNSQVLQKLALISLGRRAGLSLDEIGKMLTSNGVNIDRALLTAKADDLDKQIKEMTVLRDNLRHTVSCKAKNHLECPTFLRLLKLAEQNQRSKNKYKKS